MILSAKCFSTDVASKYGIENAIVIHDIVSSIWADIAAGTERNNGRYWTLWSSNEMRFCYPFWTVSYAKQVFNNLVQLGVLLHSKDDPDLYALEDETYWLK